MKGITARYLAHLSAHVSWQNQASLKCDRLEIFYAPFLKLRKLTCIRKFHRCTSRYIEYSSASCVSGLRKDRSMGRRHHVVIFFPM
jgi:hypothetical protein